MENTTLGVQKLTTPLEDRRCAACEKPIFECMGFVKAGDLFTNRQPRELCGRCSFEWEWTKDGTLVQSHQVFLDTLTYFIEHENGEAATDLIFDYMDSLLLRSRFDCVDRILRKVDIYTLTTSMMRSFLTITNAAKEKLPSWEDFYIRIRERMVELKGEEKTEKIIGIFNR